MFEGIGVPLLQDSASVILAAATALVMVAKWLTVAMVAGVVGYFGEEGLDIFVTCVVLVRWV